MIRQMISHYEIIEKPRQKDGGQVGEGGMFENHPRTFLVSGCDFQPARLREFTMAGGNPPKRSVGGGVL
jgi:hypothetical protein